MKTSFILSLFGIAFLLICIPPAYANTASDDLVSEGRSLLFNNGNPTYSGLLAANEKFEAAVNAAPNDPVANFFYAVTRVLASTLEQGSGAGLETVRDLFEAFGMTSTSYKCIEDGPPYDVPKLYDHPNLPETAPEGEALRAFLAGPFVSLLDAAIGNLNVIGDTFNIRLFASEIDDDHDIEVDFGDVLLLKSGLYTLKSLVLIVSACDLDVDIREIVAIGNAGVLQIQRDLLDKYQSLLTLRADGDTSLTHAKQALLNGIDAYRDAFNFITNESDDQGDDLFYFESDEDVNDASELLTNLAEVENSLNQNRPAVLNQGTIDQQAVDFNRLFGNTGKNPLDMRAVLPEFDQHNEPIAGTFPPIDDSSPVLNGLFPDYQTNDALTRKLDLQPSGVFNVPTIPDNGISIDGSSSDWPALGLAFTDIENDEKENADFVGTDIRRLYLAKDSTYLYIGMELYDGDPKTDPRTVYVFQANASYDDADSGGDRYTYACYSGGSWRAYVYERSWPNVHGPGNFISFSDSVVTGTKFIEWKVRLTDMGNLSGKFIRAYSHAAGGVYPAMNPVSDENITRIMLDVASLSGTLTLPTTYTSGNIFISAYDGPNQNTANKPGNAVIAGPGEYIITGLPVGANVYLFARWDADGNGIKSFGDYVGRKSEPASVISGGTQNVGFSLDHEIDENDVIVKNGLYRVFGSNSFDTVQCQSAGLDDIDWGASWELIGEGNSTQIFNTDKSYSAILIIWGKEPVFYFDSFEDLVGETAFVDDADYCWSTSGLFSTDFFQSYPDGICARTGEWPGYTLFTMPGGSTAVDSNGQGKVRITLVPPEVFQGDISSNGVVGLEDALLALQILSRTTPSQPVSLEADINGDGKIGMAEAIYIMQVLAELRPLSSMLKYFGGTISKDTTLRLQGSPYVVTENIWIESGTTLTIEPGARIEFADNCKFQVDGKINALGTEETPIIFTSFKAEPWPGDWQGIYFNENATGNMAYCTIKYAQTGISCNHADPDVSHCELTNNYTGISLYCSDAIITDCVISNNTGSGISNYSSSATIRNNTISNNGWTGIESSSWEPEVYAAPIIEGNTVTGNDYGIYNQSYSTPQIINNTISDNRRCGIYSDSWEMHAQDNYRITGNTIINNSENGVYLSGYSSPTLNYNSLHDNGSHDLYINTYSANTVDARYNYWGDATTQEMEIGGNPKDITMIYDQFDDPSFPMANYAGWLAEAGGIPSDVTYTGVLKLTDAFWQEAGAYQGGDTLYVELVDPDINTSSTVQDTVTVLVASDTEDTGTPASAGEVTPGGSNHGNGTLENIQVGYSTKTETWTVICVYRGWYCDFSVTGSISGVQKSFRLYDGSEFFYLSDNGEVGFTLKAGSVDFDVGDSFTFDTTAAVIVGETVTLTETDVDTGVFQGSIVLDSSGAQGQDGDLDVKSGDLITAIYHDAADDWGRPVSIVKTALFVGTIINGQSLSQDTTWDFVGIPYLITGDVTVETGVTLTIEPGVKIIFLANRDDTASGDNPNISELRILGSLNAQGTAESMITFTSSAQRVSGDWQGIYFNENATGSLSYCVIEYAQTGISCNYAEPTINACRITNNNTGISLYGSDAIITDCAISNNTGSGISNYSSSATIRNNVISNNGWTGIESSSWEPDLYAAPFIEGNTITGNDYGIYNQGYSTPQIINNTILDNHWSGIYSDLWDSQGQDNYPITGNTIINNSYNGICLSGYSRPTVNYNSLYDNGSYDLYTYTYYEAFGVTIDATHNWWGTTDPAVIGQNIYDYSDSAWSTFINYEPFLDSENGNLAFGIYLDRPLPTAFCPVTDSIVFDARVIEPSDWTISIKNSNDEVVRTFTEINSGGLLKKWYGYKDDLTTVVPDGTYYYTIDASSTVSSAVAIPITGSVEINSQWPVAEITSPENGDLVGGTVQIVGSANAAVNFDRYELSYSTNIWSSASWSWTNITTSNTPVSDDVLASWNIPYTTEPSFVIRLKTFDTGGNSAVEYVTVNILSINNVDDDIFSPNGDGIKDDTTISAGITTPADWTITIKDSEDILVRTFSGAGSSISQVWDGMDNTASVVPEGSYTYQIGASDSGSGVMATPLTGIITIDNTPPAAPEIHVDTFEGGWVSGTITIEGTASDDNFSYYQVEYGAGASPESWTPIKTSSDGVVNDVLATLDTLTLENDTYTIRITVVDKGGNISVNSTVIIVDNFRITNVSASPVFINPAMGDESIISYELDRPANITIEIYRAYVTIDGYGNGDFQRDFQMTLLDNQPRPAGVNSETWNAKDTGGNVLDHSAYAYVIKASDGTGRSGLYDPEYVRGLVTISDCSITPSYNPYANEPVEIKYSLFAPAWVTIGGDIKKFVIEGEPRMQGENIELWDGRDGFGNIVEGTPNLAGKAEILPENVIVIKDDTLKITGVSAQAYVIIPSYGEISTIKYTLSKDASVSIAIRDPNGNNWTLLESEQQLEGPHSIEWDGTNAEGKLVWPWTADGPQGDYTVEITAFDSANNTTVMRRANIHVYR